MTKFIVDSFAWIEYLTATDKGSIVKKFVEDENNDIFTHILCLGEISSKLSRSKINTKESINTILSNSIIVNINHNDSINAGKLHSEIRGNIKDFVLVDAFILLSARNLNAKVLTGDLHFKNFKEAILV